MPGMSDYSAQAGLNWLSGQAAMPALANRFMALFTTAPTSDAGTGGTEVSGGSYARQQVAGAVVTNALTAAGNNTLHYASTPAWIVAGMTITDVTAPTAISVGTTVLSTTGTTVVMSANAAGPGVGNGDSIVFSAWPASTASAGTEPAVTPAQVLNGAAITFVTATANWGTIVAFGLYDAVSGGNFITFDSIGAFSWLPASVNLASPGVITAKAHGYNNGDSVITTQKFGGTQPTFSQSNFTGILTVANSTADTFTVTNAATAVNTSSTGDLNVRKIIQQVINSGVTAAFPAANLTLTLA